MTLFHLYIDDSGSRYPDRAQVKRSDDLDHFALGGILIRAEDVPLIRLAHTAFVQHYSLTSPLHSTKIRGRRDAFAFLRQETKKTIDFYRDLESFILDSPIVSIACVINRTGYARRYSGLHEHPWLLCQSAFAILIERSVRYVKSQNGLLSIFFEETGKMEDRNIVKYMRDMKQHGMPFQGSPAKKYMGLSAADFQSFVVDEPNRVKKTVPMVQLADLVLYPIVKGGYDASYPPYRALFQRNRIIDAVLASEDLPNQGVKFFCFENGKGPE